VTPILNPVTIERKGTKRLTKKNFRTPVALFPPNAVRASGVWQPEHAANKACTLKDRRLDNKRAIRGPEKSAHRPLIGNLNDPQTLHIDDLNKVPA
jgi:hypothetical protein